MHDQHIFIFIFIFLPFYFVNYLHYQVISAFSVIYYTVVYNFQVSESASDLCYYWYYQPIISILETAY